MFLAALEREVSQAGREGGGGLEGGSVPSQRPAGLATDSWALVRVAERQFFISGPFI